MANESLTQEYLKEIFEYKDGELYWKKVNPKNFRLGLKAGNLNPNGYLSIRINDKLYKNHRLIFLMFNGYLPKFIDHIDCNPSNNKIENLREATFSQNQHNTKKRITNTSGVKNVHWYKPLKKWMVYIMINKKRKHLGYFNNIELAELVAQEARNKYHGEYARHK